MNIKLKHLGQIELSNEVDSNGNSIFVELFGNESEGLYVQLDLARMRWRAAASGERYSAWIG